MKVQDGSPQMRLSHIGARVLHFNDRFLLMPFQFFGEKELHYEFSKELNGLRSGSLNASRYAEMKIIREFPTSHLFKRGKNEILEESPTGTRAYIDIVLKHPSGNVGFEFYFGKQTNPVEKSYYKNIYFLRKRSLSPTKALIHTQNDCLKLKSEEDLVFSWVILFIASYHDTSKSMNYFIENKREKIIQGLREIKKDTSDNIQILYIEKSYIGDLNSGGKQYIWPD